MAESQNFAKVVFLPDQEEVLNEEVRNNPAFYDLSKTNHKDIILKFQKKFSFGRLLYKMSAFFFLGGGFK